MRKKLTISIDAVVYEGLHRRAGPRSIGQYIEDLVRPHVVADDLEAEYAAMAADEEGEAEALEWSEALIQLGLS